MGLGKWASKVVGTFRRRPPRKEDFYITTLKSVRQQTVEQGKVGFPETLKQVHDEDPTADEKMIQRVYTHSVNQIDTDEDMMDPDAYFQLMEYEELQQARESSRTALNFAILALGVSTLVSAGAIING